MTSRYNIVPVLIVAFLAQTFTTQLFAKKIKRPGASRPGYCGLAYIRNKKGYHSTPISRRCRAGDAITMTIYDTTRKRTEFFMAHNKIKQLCDLKQSVIVNTYKPTGTWHNRMVMVTCAYLGTSRVARK